MYVGLYSNFLIGLIAGGCLLAKFMLSPGQTDLTEYTTFCLFGLAVCFVSGLVAACLGVTVAKKLRHNKRSWLWRSALLPVPTLMLVTIIASTPFLFLGPAHLHNASGESARVLLVAFQTGLLSIPVCLLILGLANAGQNRRKKLALSA